MPRDGALTLSDVRDPALSIVCEPCGRRETYDVARVVSRRVGLELPAKLRAHPEIERLASVEASAESGGLHCAGACRELARRFP